MIVIATHNGARFLPECVKRWEEHGTDGHEVLVVDTGSDDMASLDYLEELRVYRGPLSLYVTRTPYKGYDTGAYLWAYEKYPAEDYLFMHDSLFPKRAGIMADFREKFRSDPETGCVPWLVFHQGYDNGDQANFVGAWLGTSEMPGLGIFGPIFYTTSSRLTELKQKGRLSVRASEKNHQMALERGWAVAFGTVLRRPIHALDGIFMCGQMSANGYPSFQKHRPYRT